MSGGSPWRGWQGLLVWEIAQPRAEYGWRVSQLGAGSCCFGRGLEGWPKAAQALRWPRGACGLRGLCRCSEMCWVGSTRAGNCVPACKEVVAWGSFIAILVDLITCNSLMFRSSLKLGFLCTSVVWRAWVRTRARHVHLKLLKDTGSEESMCFTDTVAITCGDSAQADFLILLLGLIRQKWDLRRALKTKAACNQTGIKQCLW